jgi:alpha-N-arabinofuranosidase
VHFLFQQNTMRDAVLAGATLNIFNNHCDRVKMANLGTDHKCIAGCDIEPKKKSLSSLLLIM